LNTAADKIRSEIVERGAICFARFMELALYCPDCGFYEKENDTIGRRGDFYTSVSIGSLFGELLAFQFASWLAERGTGNAGRGTSQMQIIEAGAHDGWLASDILNWLRLRRAALFEQIEYCIVEPSTRRQERQRETLAGFAPRVRWIADAGSPVDDSRGAVSNPQFNGVIFSNELLDAMPVHRLGWDARRRENRGQRASGRGARTRPRSSSGAPADAWRAG